MSTATAEKVETAFTSKPNIVLPRRASGHKMTTKIPVMHSDQNVSRARQLVIEHADNFDTINYIYIVSKSKKLKGVVNIKDIFKKSPETSLKDIMQTRIVYTNVETDYEKAAHIAIKNNIKAIPLVDKKKHLIGVLPSDKILSIVDSESREDLMRFSGIIMGKGKLPGSDILESPLTSFASRAPWILVGLVGAMFTARVISSFDGLLSENIILASFIPLVAYVANAVGNQTQTLLIRDLATQPKFSQSAYAAKQYITSAMIGISCIVALMGISYIAWSDPIIGVVVGTAILIAIMVSTTLALCVPRLLVRFDLDPATGAGPFSTVIQDFLSVLIYLVTASILL